MWFKGQETYDVIVYSWVIINYKMAKFFSLSLAFLVVSSLSVNAFYLPGLRPTNFCEEKVKKQNKEADCKV